jgi:hypothetical protein
MKKALLIMTVFFSLIGGWSGMALAASTTQGSLDQVCEGITGQTGSKCGGASETKTITDLIRNILEILSWIAGIAAVIMIVISGLKYITSGGDASAISSAKSTLIYALVGVVVVLLAQSIVIFVINRVKQ